MANGGAVAPARRGLAAHVGAARGLALLLLDLLRRFVTITAMNHRSETKLPDPHGLNVRRVFRSPTATRLWNSFLCHSLSSTVLSTQCAAFSFACAAGSGSERFALLRVFSHWVPALALPPRGCSLRPGDLRRAATLAKVVFVDQQLTCKSPVEATYYSKKWYTDIAPCQHCGGELGPDMVTKLAESQKKFFSVRPSCEKGMCGSGKNNGWTLKRHKTPAQMKKEEETTKAAANLTPAQKKRARKKKKMRSSIAPPELDLTLVLLHLLIRIRSLVRIFRF